VIGSVKDSCYGIMIKYPEPGRVKTRLAAGIGTERAVLVYKRLVGRILEQTAPAAGDYERFIFYDPAERAADFIAWLPHERYILQTGKDVGERMDNAVRSLFEKGARKAVITGADIPDLDSGIIRQAFEMLDRSDVVVGPARDGGYYLIGMKSPMPELFFNIQWSTGSVFSETVGRLEQLGRSCGLLPVLSDIDTAEDLNHENTVE